MSAQSVAEALAAFNKARRKMNLSPADSFGVQEGPWNGHILEHTWDPTFQGNIWTCDRCGLRIKRTFSARDLGDKFNSSLFNWKEVEILAGFLVLLVPSDALWKSSLRRQVHVFNCNVNIVRKVLSR